MNTDVKKPLEKMDFHSKIENNQEQKKNLNGKATFYLIFCLTVAVIGSAFQVGWNIGIFNTPFYVIKDFFNQTYKEREGIPMSEARFDFLWSITNGLLPLGAAFGGIISGFVADRFGRKNGLLMTNILVIICFVLNIISKFTSQYETLIVARFICGLFCGLFTGILPLYLTEVAPQNLRGLAGTLNQLIIVFGIFVTNVFGIKEILGTEQRWPILVSIMIIIALSHIGLFFAVESPKYLYIRKHDKENAFRTLMKLRNHDTDLVDNEIHVLEVERVEMLSRQQVRWHDVFIKPSLRHPLIIAVCVHIAQQFSGINAVVFYSTRIFSKIGLEGQWPLYATILLGLVQVIMTLTCTVIIEKAGRKSLLLIGMVGLCIASFGIGLSRLFSKSYAWLDYATVLFAVIYTVFFAIGPGAIPWVITAEMFKSDARAKAGSVAVFVNWFSAFIVTVSFQFIEAAIGDYSFILFGCLLIFFSLFMLLFVPETKHKTVDEIINEFEHQTFFLFNNKTKSEIVNF